MSWKFSCERTGETPLPPEYSFSQAFNDLDPKTNSFYILQKGDDYLQCGGSKEKCTVELREYLSNGSFEHYVFYDPAGSDEPAHIPMSKGGVHRQKKHCLNHLTAIKLFECYFNGEQWPSGLSREDITDQFKGVRRPEDAPQQRVPLAVSLPPRPPSFQVYCDSVNPMPDDLLLKLNLPQSREMRRSPRKTEYIGGVEWAWSPWHSRSDSYYLNPRRSLWLLWNRWWDDNDWNSAHKWSLCGYGPKKGVDAKTAAIYLLLDVWKVEARRGLGHYHYMSKPGLLSYEELSEIARIVWPDDS